MRRKISEATTPVVLIPALGGTSFYATLDGAKSQ